MGDESPAPTTPAPTTPAPTTPDRLAGVLLAAERRPGDRGRS